MTDDQKGTVRAVDRALDLLLCFTEKKEWRVTELATRTGLHKSTVHRLLITLEEKGFVTRAKQAEQFRLGLRVLELAANYYGASDLSVLARPEMEKLRDEIGETVTLYIRDGGDRVRVQEVQSTQPVRRVAPIGQRIPLFVGASSKALLAFEPAETIAALLEEGQGILAQNWPPGLDRREFLQQLAAIRAQGYATSVEEREQGIIAVAVPIFSHSQQLIAALAVSGPANRFTLDIIPPYVPLLQASAARLGLLVP